MAGRDQSAKKQLSAELLRSQYGVDHRAKRALLLFATQIGGELLRRAEKLSTRKQQKVGLIRVIGARLEMTNEPRARGRWGMAGPKGSAEIHLNAELLASQYGVTDRRAARFHAGVAFAYSNSRERVRRDIAAVAIEVRKATKVSVIEMTNRAIRGSMRRCVRTAVVWRVACERAKYISMRSFYDLNTASQTGTHARIECGGGRGTCAAQLSSETQHFEMRKATTGGCGA